MGKSNSYESAIGRLLRIKDNQREISKFSFYYFDGINPIDVYALGLKFNYGEGVAKDLDIALNCYEYVHTGYDQAFEWAFNGNGIDIKFIESPTIGTSILNHYLLNEEIKKDCPNFCIDDDYGDFFYEVQLSLLYNAAINYNQKWALPYLNDIKFVGYQDQNSLYDDSGYISYRNKLDLLRFEAIKHLKNI